MRVATKLKEDTYSVIGYCDYNTLGQHITFKKPEGHYPKPLSRKNEAQEYKSFHVIELNSEEEGVIRAILVSTIDTAREYIPSFKTLFH